MSAWTADDMPDLSGKVVIVTGANVGLGYESALAFAEHHATVIVACRNDKRGKEAQAKIQAAVPGATVDFLPVNLANLKDIGVFADAFKAKYDRLDILMNNAGVTYVPYTQTEDGFELHFGVNYLGHFALTGLLLEVLLKTPDSRIVTLTSRLYRDGVLDFDNLMDTTSYVREQAYANSKLANLMFTFELQRRLTAAGSSTWAVAAHPGTSATNWPEGIPGLEGRIMWLVSRLMMPPPKVGARTQLYAAVSDQVKPGGFYGTENEMRGKTVELEALEMAHDREVASRLWQVSEELTGVSCSV